MSSASSLTEISAMPSGESAPAALRFASARSTLAQAADCVRMAPAVISNAESPGHQCWAQHWWPGDSAFEITAGAILTQSAAWANVERALANLNAAGALSPEGIAEISVRELAELIRPSGYNNKIG